LSIAAVMGDKALVQLLLEHDAEHIKNLGGGFNVVSIIFFIFTPKIGED